MESRARNLVVLLLATLAGGWLAGARADSAAAAYKEIGLQSKDVLSGTTLSAKVMHGETKQLVCLTTYLTGERDEATAVGVRLDVFEMSGKRLLSKYTREFGAERAGAVGRGDLQLIDLDRDGISEIIVAYETYDEPLIEQKLGEVIVHDEDGFRTAWSGPMSYDATRAARAVPQERRDRYYRELDFVATMRTRGVSLMFNKTMIAVAGQRLESPKVVQESFPLKARQDG